MIPVHFIGILLNDYVLSMRRSFEKRMQDCDKQSTPYKHYIHRNSLHLMPVKIRPLGWISHFATQAAPGKNTENIWGFRGASLPHENLANAENSENADGKSA